MDRRSERLKLIAWLVLGLTFGVQGSIAWRVLTAERLDAQRLAGERQRPRPPPPEVSKSPLERCRDAVGRAKSYPEWVVAEASCRAAHASQKSPSSEVKDLFELALRESTCVQQLGAARERNVAGESEVVVQVLRTFDPACREEAEARQLLLQAREELVGPPTRLCLELAQKKDWQSAAEWCAAAASFRCWERSAWEELPRGKRLALFGRLPKDGWRPADPVQLALLRAFEKAGAIEPFRCPRPRLFAYETPTPLELAAVRPALRERFEDPWLAVAMEHYAAGKLDEAHGLLVQRVGRGDGEAGTLLAQLGRARGSYRRGLELLTDGELEQAAPHFRRALEADELLLRDASEIRSSLRTSILESMERRALGAGDKLLRAGDRTSACSAWRLGLGFGPSAELDAKVKGECGG